MLPQPPAPAGPSEKSEPVHLTYCVARPDLSRRELRWVAWWQKAVLLCMSVFALELFLFRPLDVYGIVPGPFLGSMAIVTSMVMAVCIVCLSIPLNGWIMGLLTFVPASMPLMNLLVLLIINSQATQTLREAGLRVGLHRRRVEQAAHRGRHLRRLEVHRLPLLHGRLPVWIACLQLDHAH